MKKIHIFIYYSYLEKLQLAFIKTDNKELTINTQIIDPISLTNLNAALKKLNVEWT
jgi:hypothetical protein